MSFESGCPPKSALQQLALGRLNEQDSDEVQSHVDHCSSCADTLRELCPTQTALHLEPVAGAPSHRDFRRPVQLGQYQLLNCIGQGGMGVVYLAKHLTMERTVAVKILTPAFVGNADAIRRFRREVKASAKLSHPNIVAAFDAGEANGTHFLVTEYVEGQNLSRYVRNRGPMSASEGVELLLQIADGLAHAHARGTIHRDIKPSNLMLTTEGSVKILDMGLARLNESLGEDGPAADEPLTGSDIVLGTVGYMAPEQAFDPQGVDGRADIYGLGATLHFLLTGREMYAGKSRMETLLAHRDGAIPDLCTVRRDVPASLDAVFQKMVAKNKTQRYSTIEALQEDLIACREAISNASSTGSSIPRRADRFHTLGARSAAVAACLVVVVPLIFAAIGRFSQSPPETQGRMPPSQPPSFSPASSAAANGTTPSNSISKQVTALCREANDLWRDGQFDLAIETCDRALDLDPNSALAYLHRAKAHNGKKEYEVAIGDASAAIQLDPQIASAYGNRGWANHQLLRYQDAIRDYKEAVRHGARTAQTYSNLGYCYTQIDEHKLAIESFNQALDIDSKYLFALRYRGWAYDAISDFDRAIQDYTAAIELGDADGFGHANRGYCYYSTKNLGQAIDDLTVAVQLNPDSHFAHDFLGRSYQGISNFDRAIKHYTEAIRLGRKPATMYANRGVCFAANGDFASAIRDYDQAIQIDPDYAFAYLCRSNAHRSQGDLDLAQTDRARALKLDPGLAD